MDHQRSLADHWQFSLAVYTREGVAEHCLALQQALGLDVNVLLIMFWAAGRWGCAPTAEQIAAADRQIAAWRQEVVVPLRQVRTRLKNGPEPAPCAMTDGLRQEIKRLELDAERMQQGVLAQWVKEQRQAISGSQYAVDLSQDQEAPQATGSGLSVAAQNDTGTASSEQQRPAGMDRHSQEQAILEQTAIRVVAFYEKQARQSMPLIPDDLASGQYPVPEYAQQAVPGHVTAGDELLVQSEDAVSEAREMQDHPAERAPDQWLALQHAHQIALAVTAVLASAG